MMSMLYRTLARIRALFFKSELDRQLEEDLRTHIEFLTEDNVRSGMDPKRARREALLKVGSRDAAMELHRDTRGVPVFENLLQDIRHGTRLLRRAPCFSLTAVLSLALGIGANTAIFTVINTVLLHPLPYPDSDRIVNITRQDGGNSSVPMFTYWEQNNPGVADLSAYQPGASINLGGGDRPELVEALRVSRNYFRLFGANPVLGRTFTANEDQPGGSRVVVMSYVLWQRRFGADPSIPGKTITLGGGPYTVIGVISPGFRPYPSADVWIPLQADANSMNEAHILTVSGRLPGGTTLAQANSRLATIGKQFVQAHPQQLGSDDRLQATFMRQLMTGDIRASLFILLGAVGLVLLTACANVANLLLARAAERRREIAIRAAIGGGRGRVTRQLLAESLLLALPAGVFGLLVGSWGVRALLALTPGDLPRAPEMASVPALDPWIAGFTLALTVVTGLLFGLVPAIQLSRTDLVTALRESSGRTGTGLKQNRTRSVLVAAEVAMAVVLLCGALLLIRSFVAMHNVSLGLDPNNLLTIDVSLAGPGYSRSSDVDRLAREFVDRAEQIPGVEFAAVASGLPLEGRMDMIFDIPGRPRLQGRKFAGDVQWRFGSERYFEALRIPLLSGRVFRKHESGRTVVVNQAMAREFWPNINPVGQEIIIGPGLGGLFPEGVTEIVGVVGDVRELLDVDPPPTMYQAPLQIPDAAMAVLNQIQPGAVIVRTREGIPPMTVEPAIRQALLTGGLPAGKVRTMEQVALNSTARQNFNLLLLGLFAAIALLLAAVGIYGVMSYSVEQRKHEIGIRAVLGASRGNILSLVLFQALCMTLAGTAIGLAAAFGLTRLIRAQLFGVTPWDPATFIAVPLILIGIALLAACIPALRASGMDPAVPLRHE